MRRFANAAISIQATVLGTDVYGSMSNEHAIAIVDAAFIAS